MQKQSSYIFLKRDDIDKPENIDNLISKKFPNAKEDNTGILRINNIKRKCEIDSCSVFFNLKIIPFIANYLDITVEGEEESAIIKCLEEVQDKLLNSGIRDNYIAIISYDAISEYYCNKMVVKLNEFERNLRKLFFNIYILNFGKEYYNVCTSQNIRENINKRIKNKDRQNKDRQNKEIKSDYNLKNDKEVDKILHLQQFFYSFEFGDIERFLTTSYLTENEKKANEEFLSEHSDLSKLTDEELRNAFSKFLPKSDWDRFFSEKIKIDNIKELIDEIRKYRNSVAHFKFFYNKDYTECNKKVTELNNAIIEAIRITEEKDFAERNNLNEETNSIMLEAINKLSKQMSEPPEIIISIIIALAQMRSNLAIDSQIPQIPIPNIQSEDDNIDFSDHDIDDKDEAAADDNT